MFISIAASLADSVAVANLVNLDLGRGAIAGAFIVAIAFLAGYAAIRRSGLAVCALIMVATAAALEFSWLGFAPAFSADISVLLLGVFAAAAIVFLSAAVGSARYNPVIGGVMFTAALIIAGMGVINLFDRIDLAPLMRWSVVGVAGFAAVLTAINAVKGDTGARLILPGVAIAAMAPLFGSLGAIEGAASGILGHAVFALGILAASIVALTEGAAPRPKGLVSGPGGVQSSFTASDHRTHDPIARHHRGRNERDEIVLDSQIARVLDYSGVAIWDWSARGSDQTETFHEIMGADSAAPFTPEALKKFVHADDAALFESEILQPVDGSFDVSLKLFDGRIVRFRGARAADEKAGVIERIVVFAEPMAFAASSKNDAQLRMASEAAIVPGVAALQAGKISAAIENGDIAPAYQPIVSLDNKKVTGYEALARWSSDDEGDVIEPETFVRAAQLSGKGDALAMTMLRQSASFLADTMRSERRQDLFMAINVAWDQIRSPAFAEAVADVIAEFKLPKKALVLELTEADAVSDDAEAARAFTALKKAGAALAFDDFGAGFTSLSNLRKYDFDYLKIDKSFADDLTTGRDGAKIVKALASLGADLGLKVIVEGIESQDAARAAQKAGCGYGQGFALGKPVAASNAPGKAAAKASGLDEAAEKPSDLAVDEIASEPSAKSDNATETLAAEPSDDDAASSVEVDGEPEYAEVVLATDAEAPTKKGYRFWRTSRRL